LIKFIEQWGTGTNRIVNSCLNYGLPEPMFEEITGGLVVTLRKEISAESLREMGLNERQIKTVRYIREKGYITSKEYQSLFNVSRATATRDMKSLEEKGIVKSRGTGKRDLKYVLR